MYIYIYICIYVYYQDSRHTRHVESDEENTYIYIYIYMLGEHPFRVVFSDAGALHALSHAASSLHGPVEMKNHSSDAAPAHSASIDEVELFGIRCRLRLGSAQESARQTE